MIPFRWYHYLYKRAASRGLTEVFKIAIKSARLWARISKILWLAKRKVPAVIREIDVVAYSELRLGLL